MAKSEESVLVVVRCRPLNGREIEQELEESGGRSKKKEDKHESHTSTPSSTGANAFVGGCVNMVTKTGLVIHMDNLIRLYLITTQNYIAIIIQKGNNLDNLLQSSGDTFVDGASEL
jgi:hypothetical protein